MKVRLNKEQQRKLDFFFKNKDELLLEFSKIVGIGKLNYSIKELISFENKVKELLNEEKTAVLYNIYIGEVILKNIKGEWSIGKFKKDPAFNQLIILKEDKSKMRLCPIVDWFGLLKRGELEEGISGMVQKVIHYEKMTNKDE